MFSRSRESCSFLGKLRILKQLDGETAVTTGLLSPLFRSRTPPALRNEQKPDPQYMHPLFPLLYSKVGSGTARDTTFD